MKYQLDAANMAGVFGLSQLDMIRLLGLDRTERQENPGVTLTAFARIWNRCQSWIDDPGQFIIWFSEEQIPELGDRTAFEVFAEPRGPEKLERYVEHIDVGGHRDRQAQP